MQGGDTLLLYTDGITEAANDAGESYGRERLLSCVCEDVPNAQHIIDCVVHKHEPNTLANLWRCQAHATVFLHGGQHRFVKR